VTRDYVQNYKMRLCKTAVPPLYIHGNGIQFRISNYVESIDSWFWQLPQHDLPPSSMRPMTIATIVDQPAYVILTCLSNCGEWSYRPESRRRPKI